jgi:cell division protein FtsN
VVTPPAPAPAAAPSAASRYWVQIRAYRETRGADDYAKSISSKHPNIKVFAHKIEGKDYHRVRVGPFDSKAQAKTAAELLAAEGHEIWVAGD